MKTLYVINYDNRFFTVEIPVMTENDTQYFVDFERLTADQKRALDWDDVLDKSQENTANWTTDKTRFETLKHEYIKNKLAQFKANAICANDRLDRAVLSAHHMGFIF